MKVVATAKGYHGSKVREPGEEFVLGNPETEFSKKWMKEVGKAKEEPKPKTKKAAK